jgi:hypothetical protein
MCINMYLFFAENVKGSQKLREFQRQIFLKTKLFLWNCIFASNIFAENLSLSNLLLVLKIDYLNFEILVI